MREPWQNVVEIHPRLERIETNSQYAQIISPSEMIAIITINIKIGDVEGLMNICLPYIVLEPVMDKLNTKYWFSTMQENNDENYEEYIEAMIKRVEVPVKAVLGRSSLSVNDFINLQVGDIIRLDSRIDEELKNKSYQQYYNNLVQIIYGGLEEDDGLEEDNDAKLIEYVKNCDIAVDSYYTHYQLYINLLEEKIKEKEAVQGDEV